MVYQNKLVAAIKVNGKVLRENAGTVLLPFGSEYSLYLKNLNSVRVLVSVSIDGKDATDGTQLVIQPNSSIDLERYIRNGNFDRGNRFKFIERSAEVEAHRGIEADDGIIRVEYKTERVVREVQKTVERIHYHDTWLPYYHWYYPRWPYRPYWPYEGPYCGDGFSGTITSNTTTSGSLNDSIIGASSSLGQAQNTSVSNFQSEQNEQKASVHQMNMMRMSAPPQELNDAGITVPGSESNQQFHSVSSFPTETHSDVIVLTLRGQVGGHEVSQPVTVAHKPKCQTCGTTSKANQQFCGKCGTALSIL